MLNRGWLWHWNGELAARGAEDFVLELAEAALLAAVLQFGFDRVHLILHAADAGFDICDVVFRGHVLHDVREHVADLFERDLLGHAGIVRARGNRTIDVQRE